MTPSCIFLTIAFSSLEHLSSFFSPTHCLPTAPCSLAGQTASLPEYQINNPFLNDQHVSQGAAGPRFH